MRTRLIGVTLDAGGLAGYILQGGREQQCKHSMGRVKQTSLSFGRGLLQQRTCMLTLPAIDCSPLFRDVSQDS